MADIFISYARSTEPQAKQIAEALRDLGYGVWRDDELPAHRAYNEVIEERLKAAGAVVVIWSADAVKSQWVRSEADRAREDGKLVQLTLDGARLPMPFDQIQCADLSGWNGDTAAAGWRKVVAGIGDLLVDAKNEPAILTPPLPTKPSIAVLPFANLSGDPEQEYFADGMVVEIVASLSRVRSIFVIASGSGLSFKGKGLSPSIRRRSCTTRVMHSRIRPMAPRRAWPRMARRYGPMMAGRRMWLISTTPRPGAISAATRPARAGRGGNSSTATGNWRNSPSTQIRETHENDPAAGLFGRLGGGRRPCLDQQPRPDRTGAGRCVDRYDRAVC